MKPFKFDKLDLPGYKPQEFGGVTLDRSHDAYTGHTEDDAASRDAVTHEAPTMPGSSTGECAIEQAMGVPGQDYEASWGISVSFRKFPLRLIK